jgi:signal recognition particle GTPase
MFDNLTDRLSKVVKNLRGQGRLTEANVQDALREVRVACWRPTWPCPWCATSSPR